MVRGQRSRCNGQRSQVKGQRSVVEGRRSKVGACAPRLACMCTARVAHLRICTARLRMQAARMHSECACAPVDRCRPECTENLVKHSGNEQRKRAHDTLWPDYFGSQVVPVEGGKGGGKPPPGKGEGKLITHYCLSDTPWA